MYLLFERLTNEQPKHSISELKTAIQDQIQRLVTSHVISRSDKEADLLNMGIPSVSIMARGSDHQMAFWSLRLRELINKFEPRIELTSVLLVPTGNIYAPLKVAIDGILKCDEEIDTMHFSVNLGND